MCIAAIERRLLEDGISETQRPFRDVWIMLIFGGCPSNHG
jgi:hypothetical protein